MHRLAVILILFALPLTTVFARGIRPMGKDEKPHSFWRHNFVATWNDRTLDRSLDEYPNVRVNSDNSGQLQNEEQVCINPTNPDNMVAVWRDFRLGYRRVGIGYSFDRGQTWTDALFPQWIYDWASDPVLVVDDEGVFTAMMIHYQSDHVENGLLQISSHDGGITWQDSLWAVLSTDGSSFEDKEMLAVDTSALSPYYGTFYCTWAHFFRGGDGGFDSTNIRLTYKRPGEPYSEPIALSPQTSVQWPNVAIGINGEVYISWLGWQWTSEQGWFTATSFSRSIDGGETFSEPADVRLTNFTSAEIEPGLLIFSYGALAVDHSDGPHRGRLYMVITDGEQFQDADVFMLYSDDHGDTWSEPVIVHDDNTQYPVDQFHPWISVDEEGRVWIAFYDRRNDPNNLLMDLYFTVSGDGGETWRANERITSVSSDPGAGSLDAGLIGEYIGWCAQGGDAVAVWTDTRLGNQDCFSAYIDSIFVDTSDAVSDGSALLPSTFTLAAYPNPTNSEITLQYKLDAPATIELYLCNTLGQTVLRQQLGFHTSGIFTRQLDLADFSTGLYLVQLRADGKSVNRKIMLLK